MLDRADMVICTIDLENGDRKMRCYTINRYRRVNEAFELYKLPEQQPLVEHPWSHSRETLFPIAMKNLLVVPPLSLPKLLTCLADLLCSFQASMELGHTGLRQPKFLVHELFLVCVLL